MHDSAVVVVVVIVKVVVVIVVVDALPTSLDVIPTSPRRCHLYVDVVVGPG